MQAASLATFLDRFPNEAACLDHLRQLRWPDGFCCRACGGARGVRLRGRPRTVQCAACGHQESVTAGTVFHRTRTPLRKWFLAAYLMMRDKRGIAATMLAETHPLERTPR